MLDLTAQKQNKLETLNIDQIILYKEKAVKIRNTGKILTIAGPSATAGSSLILWGLMMKYMHSGPDWVNHIIPICVTLFWCGNVATIVGIPLWVTGASRLKKAELALKKFDLVPKNSMALGVGITLRF